MKKVKLFFAVSVASIVLSMTSFAGENCQSSKRSQKNDILSVLMNLKKSWSASRKIIISTCLS